jgi:hypothetical protein
MIRAGAAPESQKQENTERTQFPLEPHESKPSSHPAIEPARDSGFRRAPTSSTLLIRVYLRSSAAKILFLLPQRKEPA